MSRWATSAARLTGYTIKVDQLAHKAQVLIPHISMDFYGRNAMLDPLKLQRLMSGARILAFHIPAEGASKTFLEYNEMTNNIFTFMASSRTEISPDFYQIPNTVVLPSLAVDIKLGNIGSSSLSTTAELLDTATGQVFAKSVNQVVSVDKTTRKAVPLPDWWKQKYHAAAQGEAYRLVIPLMKIPETCYKYEIKVMWSDTDTYRHTNYVAYIRFCKDAATDAVDNKYFTRLEGDLLNYPTKSMQMMYRGESLPNQLLTVSAWEDAHNPYLIHFDISRESSTIFQSSIEYHSPKTE